MKHISNYIMLLLLFWGLLSGACNKLVEIGEPVNTITTEQVFTTDANASAAVAQIYSDMVVGSQGGGFSIGNGLLTAFTGLSSDELNCFTSDPEILQIQDNAIIATNSSFYSRVWSAAYTDIYYANVVIEGLQASTSVSDSLKRKLTGEAKFIRAFFYFYLVNLFGDVPLVTSSSWAKTNLMQRTPVSNVYDQIVKDLVDAKPSLPVDYSATGGERIRPNKYAAATLLSRVYLYKEKWLEAENEATDVLNNSALYKLAASPAGVFGKNNTESIWQLSISNTISPYTVLEGNQFLPANNTASPTYYLTAQLLAEFEKGDLRKQAWLNSTNYPSGSSSIYYYPYKYTVRRGTVNGTVSQYYTIFRLAELFLIRAESRAYQGKLTDAAADVDTLRHRSGLVSITAASQSELLSAIAHERKVELFAEWGHRWMDLKRTKMADIVLSSIKPRWKTTQQLYPIPVQEIQTNPNLTQNPGY
ncbi:MAG: RagB/SusD family nutrient uptake outer membrane protein [Chitinophagaceae bacterium]